MNSIRAIFVIALLTFVGCASSSHNGNAGESHGQATVVWVSIDGLRNDYVQRVQPLTLTKLEREGAFTNQLRPIFPSLTFPNHTAQVTGRSVDGHGIPMNTFHDVATAQTYNFPADSSLLRAEPIWVTAKRQGVRVAIIDWPVSQGQQPGPTESDYHPPQFDQNRTDAQRTDQAIEVLQSDKGQPPLRLVMSYLALIDHDGHKYGPDAPEISDAVKQTDATLGRFFQAVLAWFDASHPATSGDELYFIVTTDHGMEPVHTLVNLDRLAGAELMKDARLVTSGPVASIYLDQLPAEQRDVRAKHIVAKLRSNPFLSAWRAADVPSSLHYRDPTRIGDVIVSLAPGYSWTSDRTATTRPATAGPHGMHGYDPAICPNMLGTAFIWRYRRSIGGKDLGPLDNTQWHATVAKLLGIERAKGSDSRAIKLR